MAKKLPPNLEGEVLGKVGEGWSSRKIAGWLQSDHGVSIGHGAVSRFVKQTGTERSDATKAVVRQKLQRTAVNDLQHLENYRRRLRRMERRVELLGKKEGIEPRVALAAVETQADLIERQRRIVDTRLHYAGVDQPDSPAEVAKQMDEELARKFDALLEKEEAQAEQVH